MKHAALVFAALACVSSVASADPVCPAGPAPSLEPPPPGLRLRTHVRPSDHKWIGPAVPSFVPGSSNGLKLDLLDLSGGAWVAVYREDLGAACGAATPGARNCRAEVRIFDCDGAEKADVPLAPLLSRPDHLEVQDVRYADGTLYFNEACQSYSVEAGRRCSALVAVAPTTKRVLWRTRSLVSNNWFVVAGDWIVAAYGFTNEPSTIAIVRRSDGAIVDTQRLPHTNFEMTLEGDVVGVDLWYDIGRVHYRILAMHDTRPALLRVD